MKHNRLLALLTAALMLFAPVAQASTSHIASFYQTDGVEMYTLDEIGNAPVPDGLGLFYSLFHRGNPDATVYVFRMPNGRALLSISCLETGAEGSTQALYEQKDALAQALMESLNGLMTTAPSFTLEEKYGQQALTADVTLYIHESSEDRFQVEGQVTAFYRGEDLIEVWAVNPGMVNYLFDQGSVAELEEDLSCLAVLEASLDFSLPEDANAPANDLQALLEGDPEDDDFIDPATLPTATITAEDGSFRMEAPQDTIVIHPGTDAADVAAAREVFSQLPSGGECFDIWYRDVTETNCTLLLSREYGIAAQVFVVNGGTLVDQTSEELLLLEDSVLSLMQNRYDQAMLADEYALADIDGMEHVWFTYDLYQGKANLLSFVLAAADGTNLYELDIYAMIDDNTQTDEIIAFITTMMETLDYLPEMDV